MPPTGWAARPRVRCTESSTCRRRRRRRPAASTSTACERSALLLCARSDAHCVVGGAWWAVQQRRHVRCARPGRQHTNMRVFSAGASTGPSPASAATTRPSWWARSSRREPASWPATAATWGQTHEPRNLMCACVDGAQPLGAQHLGPCDFACDGAGPQTTPGRAAAQAVGQQLRCGRRASTHTHSVLFRVELGAGAATTALTQRCNAKRCGREQRRERARFTSVPAAREQYSQMRAALCSDGTPQRISRASSNSRGRTPGSSGGPRTSYVITTAVLLLLCFSGAPALAQMTWPLTGHLSPPDGKVTVTVDVLIDSVEQIDANANLWTGFVCE